MKFPLHPFAILTAGVLCLTPSCPARNDRLQPAAPSSPAPGSKQGEAPAIDSDSVEIPGPLRSFLRMAGISPEIEPRDVLPLLSRNVFVRGYEEGEETEFLLLVRRYLTYARELQGLTDASGAIRVTGCNDAEPLVRALGYRIEGGCGNPGAYLATASPRRAFLTLDSGFPVTALEEAIQKHTTFTYPFVSTRVPVLFRERDWLAVSSWHAQKGDNLVDTLLHDPDVARLYWAMSRIDTETQAELRRSPGMRTLVPLAPALDFYGSGICIRHGRVLVPGGPDAVRTWEELVGANVRSPGTFVRRLLSQDHGWQAAYFDALSHVSLAQQVHLTEGNRLKFLFNVYFAGAAGDSATRGMFPSNGDLMILFHELQWEPNDNVYIPGNLSIWRNILLEKTESKLVRGWVNRVRSWDSPDQLLATMIALSHYETKDGPLALYLTINEFDHRRASQPLSDATLRLMAASFSKFHAWYPVFAEFPALDDASIARFLTAAEAINKISQPALRSNALGAFQADIGIWNILARQQEIPGNQLNTSWQQAMEPFIGVSSSTQLFDATRNSLKSMVQAATGSSTVSQEQLIDLLAGPPQESAAGQQVRQILAARMRAVLDDQRLVSLDTLYGLYDGLNDMAHGIAMSDSLISLAGGLREFEMPRPVFSNSERIEWAPEIYTSRHAELQVRADLTRVILMHESPVQLEAARGQLTPFLRDTLVGLNYAYYEPPGAQVLHHDPLFVRSHDFSAESVEGISDIWDVPELMGIGVTAGGGAYLIGSLAGLPYALASAEENFISPAKVQALIWEDVVPSLLVDAVEPRWWGVSATEMHAAALYQRTGEEILRAAGSNAEVRTQVIRILSDRLSSKRLEMAEETLDQPGSAAALIPQMLPSETFYLAAELRAEDPAEASGWGPASRELEQLAQKDPSETSVERLSRDFGVPHPTLDESDVCALVNIKPFPALAGHASRLFGESWQSNNLYWARLADEMGYPPVMLNLLVPALTQRMVANIFATDIEDRAALLRALQQTGEEFRKGQIRVQMADTTATSPDGQGW